MAEIRPQPWQAMDAGTLEWEYNPRVTVGDPQPFFAAYQAASDRARSRLRVKADIRYGDGPLQTLDVYPAGQASAPVHVFFHGGYWRSQDKRDYAFVAERLVPAGVTTVVANYDLCPAVRLSDIEQEAIACLDYVLANEHAIEGNVRRLSVSGHSAGGQLVMRLLRDRAECIDAVTAISGVFDLSPLPRTSVNAELGLDEASAWSSSPMFWDFAPGDVPVWLLVGGAESMEFRRQSADFHARLVASGLDCRHDEVPDTNHYSVLSCLFSSPDCVLRLIGEGGPGAMTS